MGRSSPRIDHRRAGRRVIDGEVVPSHRSSTGGPSRHHQVGDAMQTLLARIRDPAGTHRGACLSRIAGEDCAGLRA
jgi:hypothetical protein